ncbi:hypothetical protein [Aurantimonas sp. 22II-16-19i]|uniref:hypothetical protein n=1 Tax=Aurantimonas sp. 22II-16-19i TaxID=1317114 RepID=UPI0009F7B455|nr:hypothetical protein [Aurantimonas sp. 22II-16-19i]ORE91025.1 hypothetical protein ATO4_20224 [Aurantimonas sp. 22II-16-19i]
MAYNGLHPGWDGDDASAPTAAAIEAALAFIDLLPLGSDPTGTMIEPSGEVGFYWKDKGRYIDITFDGNDIIYYAKVASHDRGNTIIAMGRKPYNGRYLPDDLVSALTA